MGIFLMMVIMSIGIVGLLVCGVASISGLVISITCFIQCDVEDSLDAFRSFIIMGVAAFVFYLIVTIGAYFAPDSTGYSFWLK